MVCAIRHMYGIDHVAMIAKALDEAGVDAIEVAHGDGLSGASFNYGFGAHTDWEWIEAVADVIDNAVLTTLILPGIATVEELKRAYDLGVRSVRVAALHRSRCVQTAYWYCAGFGDGHHRLFNDEPYE